MHKPQDLEQERDQLLRVIEMVLPERVRETLQAAYEPPVEPKVVVSKNEVGSEYADER